MPVINNNRPRLGATGNKPSYSSGSGSLSGSQKAGLLLAAVLVGPAILKKVYEKPETVDLSSFNMVTHYDTPAIEKMDSTLRIEFCSSCQVNGQFKRCAQGLMQNFPGLKVEGGPYTPPISVQYTIRAMRAAQVSVGVFFLFGEQIFHKLGKAPPQLLYQMHDNKLLTAGAVYALDVVAQTAKSINAFEITYNGELLHSKLKTGQFPDPSRLNQALGDIVDKEKQHSGTAAAAAAPGESK